MAIRPNRYNDPALGAGFESLASLFAPMGGSDVAGYAAADASRQKALLDAQKYGLIDLFTQDGLDASRRDVLGAASGLYNPTQGFGARDMADATSRRGQDLTLEGTKYGHDTTLRGNVFDTLLKPVGEGEIRPGLSDDIAAWVGLPTGVEGVEGRVKPMTEDQVAGTVLQQAVDGGQYTSQHAADARIYAGSPVKVLGEDGVPVFADPTSATRDRLPVYEAPNAESVKLTNVRLPDGTMTTAQQTPTGLVDPVTKQPLPPGTTMFSTAAQGSAEEVGLTRTTSSKVEQQQLDISQAIGTAQSLRNMIADNGASQGLVGYARMTAQNLMQSGTELGNFLGGTAQEAAEAARAGTLDAGLIKEMFDPSLPAIDMLGNMLAFQYAKSLTGERLSNEMLRSARAALGMNRPLSNQADSLARLDMAIQQMESQRNLLSEAMASGEIGSMAPVDVNGLPPPAASGGSGGRVRYDAQGNRIE